MKLKKENKEVEFAVSYLVPGSANYVRTTNGLEIEFGEDPKYVFKPENNGSFLCAKDCFNEIKSKYPDANIAEILVTYSTYDFVETRTYKAYLDTNAIILSTITRVNTPKQHIKSVHNENWILETI